ncbi:MAG: hypothetical protein U0528_10225 [Anaerolineae bacterium]|nr:hypothetical protein [Anaerolineae bacterium]
MSDPNQRDFGEVPPVEEFMVEPASRDDSLLDLISDLIGQSNTNYAKTLLASAQQKSDQAWTHFNEGFDLDDDIQKLTIFHLMSGMAGQHRHKTAQ